MVNQKREKRSGAARKVAEALAILKALRVPREQQNERSALTLLALLGLTPRKAWAEAEAPMLGITEMMNHLDMEQSYLRRLGLAFDKHGKMPDVLVHMPDKNWLVLIEAVTTHGPIGIKRHNELKELFKGAKAGLVFVTAFLTRRAMTKYLSEIAWETEVWIAEAPSHIVHFNGERFLGPYE